MANKMQKANEKLSVLNKTFDTNFCALVLIGLIILSIPKEQPISVKYKNEKNEKDKKRPSKTTSYQTQINHKLDCH